MYQVMHDTENMLFPQKMIKKTQTQTTKYKMKEKAKNERIWCLYHKSNKHNSEDCRAKTVSNDNKRNIELKSYAIMKPRIQPQNVELDILVHDYSKKALVDTESVQHYITNEFASKFNLERLQLQRKAYVELADSTTLPIKEMYNVNFIVSNNQHIIHMDTFRVLPKSNSTMILGMEFLQKNDAIINIKDRTMYIDG